MTSSDEEPRGYLLALTHIQEAILSGDLRVGDKLPSERELAGELGVSRGAVREAIRVLQAYGILESQPGPGRGTRVIAMQSRALGKLFRLHVATASQSREDLSETRIALERATCKLAAETCSDEDLERLTHIVDSMDATQELTMFNDLDTSFHKEIARVAGNPLLGDLTAAIRSALRNPILFASLELRGWGELRERLCVEHRGILDAIKSRDGQRAADLVEAHIRNAANTLFAR
ncbi:FadR/GntR family transcriptional regulator [Tessaracoccus sp. OH4464_COT-324]|uniref:FadR/GntR family transcriptional regulator n=1 Tax=Tessaracoccus sp. OH4464_COT-324 TaxID=2491059 RepID=UPI000F6439ED|nr:FadR/GntR family transcriptional regulator [Tessaracoccus sp. OH4464_COT-324]RRD47963.1 FadR family transcriptional regulator [Tessaracoccus sp. OH4464_COT-324]